MGEFSYVVPEGCYFVFNSKNKWSAEKSHFPMFFDLEDMVEVQEKHIVFKSKNCPYLFYHFKKEDLKIVS